MLKCTIVYIYISFDTIIYYI